jgi:hypothetical protein
MAFPTRPAAYTSRAAAEGPALALAATRRGWPAPAVYSDDTSPADSYGPELDRLEAAITAGRHDALLMPMPATLSDPARLMRLLSCCTRHGVIVSFIPGFFPPPGELPGTLASARLEALAGLYPAWRIWLDHSGWHARRRSSEYVQSYRPGAPAFCVHAANATDLAAQLCWQEAADVHAPDGCSARR